jgi:YVTN family beta-propeller protein
MKNRTRMNVLGALLLAAGCSSSSGYGTGTGTGAMTGAPALKAYVGLFGDNAVAVVDTSTYQVTKTIPVPPGPHGLVITPDGARVFVSSDGASTVTVIDTATDTIAATIDVGMTPHGLSISHDGKHVLCAGFGTDSAQVIDTATNQVTSKMGVARPHNSAISPDGNEAFVGSQQKDAPSIAVVGLDTGMVETSVPLKQAPRALDFAPGGKVYFTVAGVDGLEVLDPQSYQVAAAPIATGGSPHHMLSTRDGAFEMVVSQVAGDLEFVDVSQGKVVAAVPTGKAPHWIGLSADGSRAWVTNESDNSVSVVDVAQRKVLSTFPVGNAPRKIALQPAAGGAK